MDTVEDDRLEPREKLVVFFDVCSSSKLLLNLNEREKLKHYRDLFIALKEFLLEQEDKGLCEVYKFIGDGWVLLLPPSVKGERFIIFLCRLAELFDKKLDPLVRSWLESTPTVLGLTFGVDKGRLIKLRMGNQQEYMGRALNIAARLQGAVKEKDKGTVKEKNPAYKILMSKPAFNDLEIPAKYQVKEVIRKLRNIHDNYECVELSLVNHLSLLNPPAPDSEGGE
jgi:class 3 adenylate cyclase